MLHRCGLSITLLLALLGASARGGPLDADGLTVYQTRYYIMHTDLAEPDAREAAIRMTKMAEEYHNRTSGFSGTIRDKLPFFLFKNAEDYYKAGGMQGSAGVFNGRALMSIAGEHPTSATWHIVQHEGFHQFAAAVIGGRLPPWLNEGLAEYFGEAVFTGDSFVSGLIPPLRLRQIQAEMSTDKEGGFQPLSDLMLMSPSEWNGSLRAINYDQAWSIVHFLAHGDNGKYQRAFVAFMRQLGKGTDWQNAWHGTFGDTNGFEQRWKQYWTSMPENPTDEQYAVATVTTLSGFLGRAAEKKQTFETFEAYMQAVEDHKLEIPEQDWLPTSLIETAAAVSKRRIEGGATFTLAGPHMNQVVCVLPNGAHITGHYTVRGNAISSVTADLTEPKPPKPDKK